MLTLEIMREYGWDWYTYESQPAWVLDMVVQKYIAERKLEKFEQDKQQQNNG